MIQRIKFEHFWVQASLVILIASVFVLWKSFNLALTGDDYLGLWRYQEAMKNENWNALRYWLTDYGPQDTITYLIYQKYDFYAPVYYIISFLGRFLAALSFLPLIYTLTKNKWAACISGFFFAISATGLETTDWSFNVPSYFAIASLNVFFIAYFKLHQKQSLPNYTAALFLFILTIVLQPIRLAFLPFVIVALEGVAVLLNRNNLLPSLYRGLSFLIGFFLLIKLTGIGTVAGGISENGGSTFIMSSYIQEVWKLLLAKDIPKLLHPIGQLGSIFIPDSLITEKHNTASLLKIGTLILLPIIIFYCLLLFFLKYISGKIGLKETLAGCVSGIVWIEYAFYIFKIAPEYPVQTSELLITIIGGLLFITFGVFLFSYRSEKEFQTLLFTSIATIMLSYSIAWFRNPSLINETTGRYLIVASAGVAFFIGLLFSKVRHKKTFVFLFLIPLFLIHIKASRNYLHDLESARKFEETERIRSGLMIQESADREKIPSMYYFQSENPDMLYHSIIFGFPMFIHYYADAQNPWNIGYTTNYKEVFDAYIDGSSLKRFGIPEQKVLIENIRGYKIESGELRDMSKELQERVTKDAASKQ